MIHPSQSLFENDALDSWIACQFALFSMLLGLFYCGVCGVWCEVCVVCGVCDVFFCVLGVVCGVCGV